MKKVNLKKITKQIEHFSPGPASLLTAPGLALALYGPGKMPPL